MTPIFFNPRQDIDNDWVSIWKIAEFVSQSKRDHVLAPPARLEDIFRAHDPEWAMDVYHCKVSNGFGNKDPDVMDYVMASVGSFIEAAQYALKNGTVACSASQGFHHAGFAGSYGFCTFNGLMVSAVKQLKAGVDRVMIVDGDGHYGDGTDDIREMMGLEKRVSHIRRQDLSRPAQTRWEYPMWRSFFTDLIREHRPGIIYYQAGADAWDEDPFGAGYLSKDGLAYRDRGMFEAAKNEGVPVVWNLAGGYADQKTIDIHLQTLKISDEVYHGTTDPTEVPPQRAEIIR